MNESKSYNWKGLDKKVSQLSNKEIAIIYILKKINPYLTSLTRFFPFSLLWKDRRFHYKHKKITDADDLIIKIAGEKDFWFKLFSYDEDDRFLNIIGKFVPLKKDSNKYKLFQYFRKKMEKEDFYINDLDDGRVKISLIQKKFGFGDGPEICRKDALKVQYLLK